jgi:cysteine-rich repeat protein
VLENVDGFERPPVFRGTAHLLNVGKTAPYGLMGDVPDLQTFAAMAVRQHFPRSLARIPGVDFREPRHFELAALEAFMQSIFAGDQSGLNPWQLVLGPAADRGRALFLGAARCSVCHGGWFLSTPKPVVFPPRFDTGVARQPINLVSPPGFPECPPIGPLEEGRLFDVPTLVGVRDTAPFFHDNSAATLREAVAFYSSESFNQSPAAAIVGTIALSPEEIDDLTAFLESLTACGNGVLDRGERCDDGNVQDGDCCSATCGTAAEDGIACDDGDACTTTKCRRGDCVVAEEPEACNQYGLVSDDEELLHPCSGADTLSPAVVACPIAFLPRDVSCKGGRGIQRRLDRGLALVEKALSVDPSRAARKMLGEAVHAFARARRLANTSASPGCDSVFGTAAAEAENRTKCLRKCIAERLDR